MATSGYNEADTRAKLIDPALHARQWVETVKDEHRATQGEMRRHLQSGTALSLEHWIVDLERRLAG